MSPIKHNFMPHKKNVALKRAIRFFVSLLKPIVTTLVFLLVSTLVPAGYVGEKVSEIVPAPCVNAAAIGSLVSNPGASYPLENKQVTVGARTLTISRHAAQRMMERGVTVSHIQKAVEVGRLFAYSHNGLIKIGYYHAASEVFLAVDRRHEKIITAITRVPRIYVHRLLFDRNT